MAAFPAEPLYYETAAHPGAPGWRIALDGVFQPEHPLAPAMASHIQAFLGYMAMVPPALQAWVHTHGLLERHGLSLTPQVGQWELEWTLCDDTTIQGLNRDYRQKDTPTDVLSFPLFEAEQQAASMPAFLKQQGGPLGNVLVSLPYAQRHASAGQVVAFVMERFIHGTLHVLGYHHDTPETFRQVVALQRHMLHALNLESTLPYDIDASLPSCSEPLPCHPENG
jgi:probable rRNA maturation factor